VFRTLNSGVFLFQNDDGDIRNWTVGASCLGSTKRGRSRRKHQRRFL